MTSTEASVGLPADNPFATVWDNAWGLPDFEAISIDHYQPAIEAGIASQQTEFDEIASNSDTPTVDNTLVAIERSGALLSRAIRPLFVLNAALGGDDFTEVTNAVYPLLVKHDDEFWLDKRMYDRFVVLGGQALDQDDAWAVREYLRRYEQRGVALAHADRQRLQELNTEISSLELNFEKLVVSARNVAAVALAEEELEGVSVDTIEALAQAARDIPTDQLPEHARDAQYVVTPLLNTHTPILSQLRNPAARRKVLDASLARGTGVDAATDTRATILTLVRLRAERAKLLGYTNHAELVADRSTARTAEAISTRLADLAARTSRKAAAERAELADLMTHDSETEDKNVFSASDWVYYSDKLRNERFSLDEEALRPYFKLERVLVDGAFFAANRLYGLTFHRRADLSGWHEDTRVWEVRDEHDEHTALFILDPYSRPDKKGGAWMNDLVEQSGIQRRRPIVTNNLNVSKPAPGKPALLTLDEVNTLFHEFGHALHSCLSQTRYPSLAGTSVPRDYVEYPSQINEKWMTHPEVMSNYARHWDTDEPMPQELQDAIRSLGAYGEGFDTGEYLGAVLIDQAWHRLEPDEIPDNVDDVQPFEARVLNEAGLDMLPPRYRSTYFSHAFGSGYDAAYYSYIWSQILDADTADWFDTVAANGGDEGFNRDAGRIFATELLARGNSRDPMDSFRAVLGRDADVTPLLTRLGLN